MFTYSLAKHRPVTKFLKLLDNQCDDDHNKADKGDDGHEKVKEKREEVDDFIARAAHLVTSKNVSAGDPPAKIESLVNLTASHLMKKMNATREHFYEFKSKLLAAVVEVRDEE